MLTFVLEALTTHNDDTFFFDEMTCDFNSVPQRILGILSYPKKKIERKKKMSD